MLGKKTSIAASAAALLMIGGCGSAALAASATHRTTAAEARASVTAPSEVGTPARDYVWTQSKEPTYMAIQDQFYRDSNGGK
jgi:hypothetical protein